MVASKLNSKVVYEEKSDISSEDDDFESLVYPVEIAFKNDEKQHNVYNIVFGQMREDKRKEGILYFPIYLIENDEAVAKIGILEIDPQRYVHILDENDDIDPEKIPELLFFNFVNKSFLQKYKTASPDTKTDETSEETGDNDILVEPDEEYDAEKEEFRPKKKNSESEDKKDLFSIPEQKPKPDKPVTTIDKNQVFTVESNFKPPTTLLEESVQDATQLRTEYQETVQSTWINKFMENNEYKIQDNEGAGDCLFAVIRDAFAQIGHMTTVSKLREFLSSEVTDSVFQEYRKIYLSMENALVDNDKKITNFITIYNDSKNKINKSGDSLNQQEHSQLLEQAKHAKKSVQLLQDENRLNRELLNDEFGYMKQIDSLDKFKNYILTSSYWADNWAIATLESKLNFKFVIFSESAFNNGSNDSVLNCGETVKEIQDQGVFTPNYYIMTSYSGNHYRLVTYKNKNIFTFREIPYDVKTLVINKCMERNSGVFYLISDFKNLKSNIGLSAEEGQPELDTDEDYLNSLYDKDIVFMFHSKSQDDALPGKGSGESIPKDKTIMFKNLHKIKQWRRKLDDSWNKAKFKLDGHFWASVEHYYQGSKFKKGFPDFYLQFSLDTTDSRIAEDVALAKLAGGKKSNEYRPKTVTIDADFYSDRNIRERMDALQAKFQQNIDLREMLILTHPAKLTHFVRRSPAEVDESLMKVRKEFMDK